MIFQGRVLTHGPPDEVKQHPTVREEYLGDLEGSEVRHSPVSRPHFRNDEERRAALQAGGSGKRLSLEQPDLRRPTRVTDV